MLSPVSAPTYEWVLQASPTSCSLQEEPMIQPSPSLAKGLQPPTGARCHVQGASSASTAPRGGSGAGSAAQLPRRLGLAVSLWAARGKAARAVPLQGAGTATSLVGGKSSREGLHNPISLPEGRCTSSKGSATLDVPCLWDPAAPLSIAPFTPAWVSWPCHSLLVLLFKMPSGSSRSPCSSLCSGLKLLHSNFFFHFISGRALELCCLPLAPSSPPSELLPGPVSFPGVPSCSQLIFNPLLFCPLLQCSYPED